MADQTVNYLLLDDPALLAQCQVHAYRSSGPGGQHRNKVSSAIRLVHLPTGIAAHGDDSRSQHENKRLALGRLRMNIALRLRRRVDRGRPELPDHVSACQFHAKKGGAGAPVRMEIGRKDFRFWTIAAFLLDVLDACEGRLGDSAAWLGITSGNLTSILASDRHLLAAAQAIRRNFRQKPIL